MLKQKARLIARVVYLVEIGLTSVAFFAAFLIRDNVLPILDAKHFPTGLYPVSEYLKIYPLVVLIWSVLLFSHRSYNSHRTVPILREAASILHIVALGVVVLATFAWLVRIDEMSRTWFALFGFLSATLLLAHRISLRAIARYVRARGLNYRTVLIVG